MKEAKNLKNFDPPLQICGQWQEEEKSKIGETFRLQKKRILKSVSFVPSHELQTSTSHKHIYSSRQVGISGFLWQTADNVVFKVLWRAVRWRRPPLVIVSFSLWSELHAITPPPQPPPHWYCQTLSACLKSIAPLNDRHKSISIYGSIFIIKHGWRWYLLRKLCILNSR